MAVPGPVLLRRATEIQTSSYQDLPGGHQVRVGRSRVRKGALPALRAVPDNWREGPVQVEHTGPEDAQGIDETNASRSRVIVWVLEWTGKIPKWCGQNLQKNIFGCSKVGVVGVSLVCVILELYFNAFCCTRNKNYISLSIIIDNVFKFKHIQMMSCCASLLPEQLGCVFVCVVYLLSLFFKNVDQRRLLRLDCGRVSQFHYYTDKARLLRVTTTFSSNIGKLAKTFRVNF